MRVSSYFKEIPLRGYIVVVFFAIASVMAGSWWLAVLLLPLYWQLYLKEDLAPKWW